MQLLKDHGIFNYLEALSNREMQLKKQKPSDIKMKLSLDDLTYGFLTLFIGISLAFLVLIFELLITKLFNAKKK